MQRNFSMISRSRIRKSSSSASNKFAAGACLLLGLAVLLCPTDRSISRADSAPEWLSAAGRADLGHFGEGSAAVILGNWTDFSVDATGEVCPNRAFRHASAEPASR